MNGRGWVVAGGATLLGWAVASACTGHDPDVAVPRVEDAAAAGDAPFTTVDDASKPRAAPGTVLWSFMAGAESLISVTSIAVANDGSAVVAGTLRGAAVFGGTVVPQGSDNDAFLLWLDPSGSVQRFRRLSAVGDPHIAATSDGGIVLATDGSQTVDGQTGHVLRFDATGKATWGKLFTTSAVSELQITDVRVQDSRVVVAGRFAQQLSLVPIAGQTASVTSSTGNDTSLDVFVAVLEDAQSGLASSLRSFSGDAASGRNTELLFSMALDANGNILLGGYVQGITFSDGLHSYDVREFDGGASATPNAFFTKIASQGVNAPSWFTFSPGKTYALGKYDRIVPSGAGTTADGTTWFAGTVMGMPSIGPFSVTANESVSATNEDIAVASFDSNGKPASLTLFSGPGEDTLGGFGTSADGVRAVAGNYSTGFGVDKATPLPAVPANGSAAFVNVVTPRGDPFTRSFVASPTDASNGRANASALGVGSDRVVAAIQLRGDVVRSDTNATIDTASLSVPDAGLTVAVGLLLVAYAH